MRAKAKGCMGVVLAVCGVLLGVLVLGNCVIGCMLKYTPKALAEEVPGWELEQREQIARQEAMMQANWDAGVYADEMADWGEE